MHVIYAFILITVGIACLASCWNVAPGLTDKGSDMDPNSFESTPELTARQTVDIKI